MERVRCVESFLMVEVCIFESLFFIVSGPKGSYLAAAAAAAVATSWQQTLTKLIRTDLCVEIGPCK